MREFFHGWRRKCGCALLVIATVLAVLWGRSIVTADCFQTGHSGFGSLRGGMYWFYCHPLEMWDWQAVPDVEIQSSSGDGSLAQILSDEFSVEPPGVVYGYVLYWWLILPLTLLAAYLILRPRGMSKT